MIFIDSRPALNLILPILFLFGIGKLNSQCNSPYDRVVLNEVSGDAGQSDGVDDGIVEIAGPPSTDIGCMVVSNSEWAIVIPEGTVIPSDGVFLIACGMRASSSVGVGIKNGKNGLNCDECDFHCLTIDFDVCDPANAVYCDFAATGFTIDNQHGSDGDQVMLFLPNGTPHDGIYWGEPNTLTRGGNTTGGASGDADHCTVQDPTKGSYTLGTGIVVMGRGDGTNADTSAVPVMPNGAGCMARLISYSMPNLTDPIWVKHPSATFVGCNSSYLRISNSVGSHGNPSHQPRAGTLIPSASLVPSSCDAAGALAQWGYTDHPNPGKENDALAWQLLYSNDTLCSPATITFTLEVYNYQNVSDNVDLFSGACDENIGSYVMAPSTDPNANPGSFGAQVWTSYSFDKNTGITTLTYTSGVLPVGTHCYTLQWDDYSNCCGSTSKTSNSECYEREEVCITVFAPLSYDCDRNGTADVPQTMCTLDCVTGGISSGTINVSKYILGGGNLCYTLYDSAGILPPKTNTNGIFTLENNPTAGGYYVTVEDKSGCSNGTLIIKINNNCEKAAICPSGIRYSSTSPSGNYCPTRDTLRFCIQANCLPPGGTIDFYIGPEDCNWVPGEEGTVVGTIDIPSCPNCNNLNPSGSCGDSGGLIINEVSQGQGGNKEWVELLAVGASCDSININGWIINDNDGSCGASGVAPGYVWFDDTNAGCPCNLKKIPVGAKLVIYNEEDKETCMLADDPCDSNGDKIYVFPGNSPCLSTCYNTDAFPCPSANRNPGGAQQGWQNGTSTSSGLLLGNTADCMITKCPDGNIYHGIEYGTNCTTLEANISCAASTSGSGNQEYYFSCGDFYADGNFARQSFTAATACTVQTIGNANNTINQNFINKLMGMNG